jgi:hypothetical protein
MLNESEIACCEKEREKNMFYFCTRENEKREIIFAIKTKKKHFMGIKFNFIQITKYYLFNSFNDTYFGGKIES